MRSTDHEEPIWNENFRIRFGTAQWSGDGDDKKSFSYEWRDRKGKFSRGTMKEIPVEVLQIGYERGVQLGLIEPFGPLPS
jgi:hypothetical protein